MKEIWKKRSARALTLLLAVMMTVGVAGESLTAAAAELEPETLSVETMDDAVVETPAEEADDMTFDEAAEPEIVEADKVEAVEADEETEKAPAGKRVITGFVVPEKGNEIQASAEDRPSLEQLTSLMDDTIQVYLDEEETPAKIAVTWYCVGDEYELGKQYYYQFSPKWDTEKYQLSDSLDVEFDAPDYGVFFGEGTGITTMKVTRSGNETKTYRYLVEKMGLKCSAALGIMANIQAESGFNPNAVNPGSTSFHGICQWGLGGATGSRWNKLKKWCKSHGCSYKSLNGQLRYMRYELENIKSYHYSSLKSVKNSSKGASSAARTFAKYYEGCSSNYWGTRQKLAGGKYWKEYSPLAKAKIEVLNDDQILYNGKAQEPELKLTKGDKTLKEDKDYKVSYSNNVEPGEATIIITGVGDYCGTLMGSFTIRTETPKLVSATCAPTGVKVKWKAVDGAVKYRLYRKVDDSWKKIKDTANLSCTDTTAVSGEINVYTVCCISTDGAVVSGRDSEGIRIYYVAAPVLKLSGNNNGVKVQWTKVQGAASCQIFRMNDDEEWEEVKTTTSASWTDKDAALNKTLSYRAISLDENGEALSCMSNKVSMKYLPAPVLKSAAGVKKGIKITWNKVPGAEKYRVYRLKDGKWKKVKDTTSTSWKDEDVKKNKTYTYTVACLTEDGKVVQSGYDSTGVSAKRKK